MYLGEDFETACDAKFAALLDAENLDDLPQRIIRLNALDAALDDFEFTHPGVSFRRTEIAQLRRDSKRRWREFIHSCAGPGPCTGQKEGGL